MLLPVVQSNDEEDGDAGHRTLSLPPLPPQGEGRKAMSATVWVVDDDRSVRFVLATALQEAGFDVVGFDAAAAVLDALATRPPRSEEHTSELQSLMRISYAVFCLKKKKESTQSQHT